MYFYIWYSYYAFNTSCTTSNKYATVTENICRYTKFEYRSVSGEEPSIEKGV